MNSSPFYIQKTRKTFTEAIEAVKANAAQAGFNLVAEHNMKNTYESHNLQWKSNYTILSICNPIKSHHALSLDKRLGCFMPKNIIVFEDDDGTVNIMMMKGDPNKMNEFFPGLGIGEMSAKTMSELISIIDNSI